MDGAHQWFGTRLVRTIDKTVRDKLLSSRAMIHSSGTGFGASFHSIQAFPFFYLTKFLWFNFNPYQNSHIQVFYVALKF